MAKWGFLKNIVNIDRFFASGAGGDAKEEKKEDAKDEEKKLAQADKSDKVEPKEEARENDKVTSEELSENASQEKTVKPDSSN